MVDCLGGVKGKYFENFRKLLHKGFMAVNKHREKISILVEMMWCGHGKNLDCFENFDYLKYFFLKVLENKVRLTNV